MSLCQRYYEQVGFSYRGSPSTALAGAVGGTSYFRVEKRIVPTLTVIGTDYFENASSGVSTSSISNIAQSATATATSRSRWVGILACDAEL